MAKLEFCTVEDEGRVRIVTLNRPEVLNALHSDAHLELEKVWDEFAARDDLWVGIVTGAGDRAFSAGNDLKVQAAGKRGQGARTGFAGICNRFDLDKPLIAAVNGVAMGGGFEIALATDIIIAAENAKFALPEPRVGFAALASGMHRLPRQNWRLRAGGPAGTSHIMAIVAPEPRDFLRGAAAGAAFSSVPVSSATSRTLFVEASGANSGSGSYGASAVVAIEEAP